MTLNDSTVEDAALETFESLGYAVAHGPHIAPGEPAVERGQFDPPMEIIAKLRAIEAEIASDLSELEAMP